MNPLRKWLEDNSVSQKTFAALLGVSQPAVWRWVQPGRFPAKSREEGIQLNTDGCVGGQAWDVYENELDAAAMSIPSLEDEPAVSLG